MRHRSLNWMLIALASGLLWAGMANAAAPCRKVGEVCMEPGGTRNINGADVTKDCWRYQDKYECVAENAVDNCAPLRAVASCYQTASTCAEKAFTGECLTYKNTYRCGEAVAGAALVQLPMTYTITNDKFNESQCKAYADNPQCQKTGSVCVEPGGTREINGLPVTKDCWRREDTFACVATQSSCEALKANANCKLTSQTCDSPNPDGSCALKSLTYSCQTGTTPPQEVQQCGTTVCANGLCFDNPDAGQDKDFVKTVTSMEVARQAAGYMRDINKPEFFKGDDNRCGKNSLKSCCKPNTRGGNMSNGAVMSAAMQTAQNAWGSWYVFDSLTSDWNNTNVLKAVYNRFAGNGPAYETAFEFTGISYYGVTFNPFLGVENMFSFSPAGFATAVAVQVVMELMSCEQDEQMLAMKNGRNLCHYVGSYCSQKMLGSCVASKETYCCFNSRLARIVQEQGRQQLGKDWGSAEAPKCGGFEQGEFEKIDLSKMDLTEFIEEIMANTKLPKSSDVEDRARQIVDEKLENYFSR